MAGEIRGAPDGDPGYGLDEDELLAVVDEMAAIVRRHALPEARKAAEDDTGRVRKFILKRRGEILADLTPEPPEWPEPREDIPAVGLQFGSLEVAFETTWASNLGANPLGEGMVVSLMFDEAEAPVEGLGVIAGPSTADERALLPGVEETASIAVLGMEDDGSITGMTLVVALEQLKAGATLIIGEDAIAGGIWTIPAGATAPDFFSPFTEGSLELAEAGTEHGSIIAGSFAGILTEPAPSPDGAGSAADSAFVGPMSLEVAFETTWASNLGANPLQEGMVVSLLFDGARVPVDGMGVTVGPSGADERALLPGVGEAASIVVLGFEADGSISGMTLVLAVDQFVAGATLVIGEDAIAGGFWTIPAGATTPDFFSAFTEGSLELSEAGTEPGSAIAGSFAGVFGEAPYPPDAGGDPASLDIGLVINEVAAKGDPLDWFELYNSSADPISLSGFVVADSLTDGGKRVAFPAGTIIGAGEYLQFLTDKDGWPGFALGSDEELGIWLVDGTPVAKVDWNEGQSGEGQSYARVPDATGEYRTVDIPTPGAPNLPLEN